MKWFDAGIKKMSGPSFGSFIKLMKLPCIGSWPLLVKSAVKKEHLVKVWQPCLFWGCKPATSCKSLANLHKSYKMFNKTQHRILNFINLKCHPLAIAIQTQGQKYQGLTWRIIFQLLDEVGHWIQRKDRYRSTWAAPPPCLRSDDLLHSVDELGHCSCRLPLLASHEAAWTFFLLAGLAPGARKEFVYHLPDIVYFDLNIYSIQYLTLNLWYRRYKTS